MQQKLLQNPLNVIKSRTSTSEKEFYIIALFDVYRGDTVAGATTRPIVGIGPVWLPAIVGFIS